MKISKTDLNHSRNMLKVLGKGKWELDGVEIMAFSEMIKWYTSLQKQIEEIVAIEEIRAREEAAKAKEDAAKPDIKPIEEKQVISEPEKKVRKKRG